MNENARLGNSCCSWIDFKESFDEAHARWFDAPPPRRTMLCAIRDWKEGNTGWEAAHNARQRARNRTRRAALAARIAGQEKKE
jgi:hypothetical protein